MITRISKIARLPRSIRDQLNHRLENGQIGRTILPWLNALPETKTIMAEFFGGSSITHQNLSEWRHGGYQDWLQQQHRKEWFDRFTENETELAEHDGCGDTYEAMSRIFIVETGQAVDALQNVKSPQERAMCLQNLMREFTRLQNAYNYSRRTQLDFDKYNGQLEPEPLEAPCCPPGPSRRHNAPTPPEPSLPRIEENHQAENRTNETNEPAEPTISVSLAPIGGLEPLGKRRKESAESGGPSRAERAGASESLGRGEGALGTQGEPHTASTEPETEPPTAASPTCVPHPTEYPEKSPAFQTIPAPAPTTPAYNKPAIYYPRIRRSRFAGLEG